VTTAAVPAPKLFIAGEFVDAQGGEVAPTINPATEAEVGKIAQAGVADVDKAVQAARQAFDGGPWKNKLSAKERAKILWKIADLIERDIDAFAELETLDNGKPIFESRYVDMPMVAEVFRYYAGFATKVFGETIPVGPASFNYTLREPVGVVGAITPWNFPLLLASWKIAPALAVGCSVVHKPATLTPMTALKLAAVAREAGVPAGVFNVVTGKGSVVGDAMVRHAGIDKLAFTGSTSVGLGVMKDAAAQSKRVSLELGGKSPNVVFADADLDAAVKGAANGIFYGKGEVCAAGSRLLVESSIHDEFVEKLKARVSKLVPGDPMNPKTRLGAIVSKEQLATVERYVAAGQKDGATLAAGGARADIGTGKGYFYSPTIFTGVTNAMTIGREEVFGPVLAVIRFDDEADAIKKANDTPFGLAGAVWSRNLAKALRVAHQIKAGTIWVNTYNMYDPATPFGGYKASGFGRELGSYGLDAYTEVKHVWVDLA
jgi:acyl-CoA reductase-like NAD-dependent aldehyde dehydrogenase